MTRELLEWIVLDVPLCDPLRIHLELVWCPGLLCPSGIAEGVGQPMGPYRHVCRPGTVSRSRQPAVQRQDRTHMTMYHLPACLPA